MGFLKRKVSEVEKRKKHKRGYVVSTAALPEKEHCVGARLNGFSSSVALL
jgi:hypothetical protein